MKSKSPSSPPAPPAVPASAASSPASSTLPVSSPAPPATPTPAAAPVLASPTLALPTLASPASEVAFPSLASKASSPPPSPPISTARGAGGGDGHYRDRDRKVLRFLRVDRLAIYQVLSLLFFGGPQKSCGHVAKRLSDAGLVEIHKRGFPGGVTWLCLSQAGARKAGLRERPPLSGSSIEDNLQTLLFCVLSESGKRRYRLEPAEVDEVYPNGVFASNVHVVLTEEFGEPVLLRCYHARAGAKSVLKALHSLVEALGAKPGMEEALRCGHVGVAPLCPTPQARNALRKEVANGTLSKYRIVIEHAPDSANLSGYLKKQKKHSK